MLLSTVLTFTVLHKGEISYYTGRMGHAWLLRRIGVYDQSLAESLHEPNEERPFTVSSLWPTEALKTKSSRPDTRAYHAEEYNADSRRADPNKRQVDVGDTFHMRITSYHPTLSEIFYHEVLNDSTTLAEPTTLGGVSLACTGNTSDAREHPWAGQSTYEALAEQLLSTSRPPKHLTMHFASPTVFKSGEHFLPMPLPRLVMEGLVRKWNTVSPIEVPPDANHYAEVGMAIAKYKLQTEAAFLGKNRILPGFVGTCRFALRLKDPYWLRLFHMLADFAFYAGMGKNTVMGLGQVRNVSHQR